MNMAAFCWSGSAIRAFLCNPEESFSTGNAPGTLARQRDEEFGAPYLQTEFLGVFSAPAANEPLHTVEAVLFLAKITRKIQPAAEIEELAWVEPSRTGDVQLASLTRDHVLPLVLSRGSQSHCD